MSRLQASVLTVLVLGMLAIPAATGAGTAGGSAAVGASPTAAGASTPGEIAADALPAVSPPIQADGVEFRLRIYANGSARWTFVYWRTLDNDTDRQRFQSFAAEFNTRETESYRDFKRQASGLTAAGRNATGRDMHAIGFSKEAYLGGDCLPEDSCGTVEMSFVWTNFARTEGEKLIVADVFEGGIYLGPDQELVFEPGPGLAFASADPDTYEQSGASLADSDSITYTGETKFPDNRPRVVFLPEEMVETTTTTGAPPTTTTISTTVPPTREGTGLWMLLGGVVVVLVGVGGALAWRRGGGAVPFGGGGADGGVAGGSVAPDEELLSDKDRVLRLLRENGGRMKQVKIVNETEWSKSKVSMLLSEMEDDGEISKLRVGRENIISLAGSEPDAASSPHER